MNDETKWDDDTLCVVFLNLIPKKSVPKAVGDFRPIAIPSVLSKLYFKLPEWLTAGVLMITQSQFRLHSNLAISATNPFWLRGIS